MFRHCTLAMGADDIRQLAGYAVLPCALPMDEGDGDPIIHYVYLKPHNLKRESKTLPNNRTLFVLNIPPGDAVDAPHCASILIPSVDPDLQDTLRALFANCGKIANIQMGPPGVSQVVDAQSLMVVILEWDWSRRLHGRKSCGQGAGPHPRHRPTATHRGCWHPE